MKMVLPDPWSPSDYLSQLYRQAAVTISAGLVVATNNDALYAPVVFPCDATIYALRFAATNTSGNYDIAFYDAALNRLVSKGSTAMANAVQTLTIPDIRVIGGETYYAGFSFSSNAAQAVRATIAVTGLHRSMGFGLQATAHPLPNPAVPGSIVATTTVCPAFAFGIR